MLENSREFKKRDKINDLKEYRLSLLNTKPFSKYGAESGSSTALSKYFCFLAYTLTIKSYE